MPSPYADAQWLRQVFDRFEGPLVRYAHRLLHDEASAQDVAQDAFLRLCKEPRGTIEDDAVGPWLFTVCRNRALDILKKEKRMNSLPVGRAEAEPSREPDQAVAAERTEQAQSALQLLEALPANQQEVIRLKLQNDLSYREISSVTGLSVSNVGYLLHVGLKSLRQRLIARAEPSG